MLQSSRKASTNMEAPLSSPSSRDFIYGLLQACHIKKDLSAGRNLYSLMIIHSLSTVSALADHLIRLLAASGSLSEATHVFLQVSNPTVYTYNAIINAHIEFSQGKQALHLYVKMHQEGLHPDKVSYLYALKACISMGASAPGQLAHYQIVLSGLDSDVLVGSTLIDMYAKCGFLKEAHRVFAALRHRNSVSWGVLITGYVQNGYGLLAIELFVTMCRECVWPEKATFLSVLKACGSVNAVKQGLQVHEQITSAGLETDDFLGNSLVDMYAKLDMMVEAHAVFENLTNRDVVSWDALISGYVRHGHDQLSVELFSKMQAQGICPDRASFLCILKAFGSLGNAEQVHMIHAEVFMYGYDTDIDIHNSTVHMYATCGRLDEAHTVFELSKHRDVVTWCALIAGHMQHEPSLLVLELTERMQEEGIRPNAYIFSSALMACGNISALKHGRLLHDQVIANRFETDKVVCNSLIDMYAKCGSVNESCNLFFKLQSPDEVSFGALIAGCAQHGQGDLALELYVRMQHEGMQFNEAIFACSLKACCSVGDANAGRLMYQQIIESGVEVDLGIGSSLVDMCAKCGCIEDAEAVFKALRVRDVVSWGAIIGGYAESENGLPAIELYNKMEQDKVTPNKVIFLSVLKACGGIAAATQGRQVHGEITRWGLESDLLVGSALVDFYAKCGSLQEAWKLLDELPTKDIIPWGSVIVGFALKGHWREARRCLETMLSHGLKPDIAIYNNILAACSHGGVLNEGVSFFRSICDQRDVTPGTVQSNLLFDLMARPGHLVEAADVLQTIPSPPEEVLWTSLLTGCTVYGNMMLARQCFDNASLLEPVDASGCNHMLNTCAEADMGEKDDKLESGRIRIMNTCDDAHMGEEDDKLQNCVRIADVEKKPGSTCVKINENMDQFVLGDAFHVGIENDEVYENITLDRFMNKEGHTLHFDKGMFHVEHIVQHNQFSYNAIYDLGKNSSKFKLWSFNTNANFSYIAETRNPILVDAFCKALFTLPS